MTAKRSKLYDVKVERAGLHDYRLTSDILRTNFKPAIQVDFSHHVFEHLEVIITYELRVEKLEIKIVNYFVFTIIDNFVASYHFRFQITTTMVLEYCIQTSTFRIESITSKRANSMATNDTESVLGNWE